MERAARISRDSIAAVQSRGYLVRFSVLIKSIWILGSEPIFSWTHPELNQGVRRAAVTKASLMEGYNLCNPKEVVIHT